MNIAAFLSSRIWLSIIASLVGAMLAWTEASWRMITPYSAGRVVAIDLSLHQIAAFVLVVFWLWIFFRRPGRPVFLDSRQALSASSVLLGAIAMLAPAPLAVGTHAPVEDLIELRIGRQQRLQSLPRLAAALPPRRPVVRWVAGKGAVHQDNGRLLRVRPGR